MERSDFIAALRKMLDVYERNPDLPAPYPNVSWIFTFEAEDFIKAVQAFGSGMKRFDGDDLEFHPDPCADLIRVNCKREQICERKVVGKRLVPEKVIPAQTIPAHEEEIVEWDCKPILAKRRPETVEIPKALEAAGSAAVTVGADIPF